MKLYLGNIKLCRIHLLYLTIQILLYNSGRKLQRIIIGNFSVWYKVIILDNTIPHFLFASTAQIEAGNQNQISHFLTSHLPDISKVIGTDWSP